jgi:hypothetical protein
MEVENHILFYQYITKTNSHLTHIDYQDSDENIETDKKKWFVINKQWKKALYPVWRQFR